MTAIWQSPKRSPFWERRSGAPAGSTAFASHRLLQTKHTCTWSKLYRDNHPLTFQLRTAQLGLGRYLQAVRAYRNGQLVYLWKSTDDGERELTIPASALTARLQPHLAPLDLRLLPVGVEVSVSVLNEIVAKESSGLQQRFHAGFTALLSDSSFAGGKLPDQLKCLEWSARYVQRAPWVWWERKRRLRIQETSLTAAARLLLQLKVTS